MRRNAEASAEWFRRASMVPVLRVVGSVGFAGLLLAVVLFSGRPSPAAQILAALSIAILVIHAVLAYGLVDAGIFLGLCLAVTFGIENLGVATGFPFGHYEFLVAPDLPHVGAIPIIVGPLYFGIGYPGWVMACLILGRTSMRPRDRFSLFALPIIAAFATVQWDIVMDPPNSTIWRAWVWYRGGGFFGVPLSNFLGWFLTAWTFFQLIALALFFRPTKLKSSRSRNFWLPPILLYLAAGFSQIPPWLIDGGGRVTDPGGGIWSAADLRETAVIVMLFSMLPTATFALLRLFDISHTFGDLDVDTAPTTDADGFA
ncbi:carotenoid biosynthesis protein [Methylobacterium sp. Leaf102]|uniref:carotenoid biosynthesis protein n=1 Tax=Methylobacterium sp. Leaf102 TaxID=1736253 RepID=UPI000A4D063A|nr:carotenoid biosynthesis protein [Methylobacterium sp. Leaf102]